MRALDPLGDGQHPAQALVGVDEIANVQVGQRQQLQGRRGFNRVGAEGPFADRQRALDERSRLSRAPLEPKDVAQLVERRRHARIHGIEVGFLQAEASLAVVQRAGGGRTIGAPPRFEQQVDGLGKRQRRRGRLRLEALHEDQRGLLGVAVAPAVQKTSDGAAGCRLGQSNGRRQLLPVRECRRRGKHGQQPYRQPPWEAKGARRQQHDGEGSS